MVEWERGVFLIRVPNDTVSKLMEIANSQGMSFSDYLAEILEQTVRVHDLNCSLKDTVDFYERTITKKETAEEVEVAREPSIDKLFEKTLTKLRPEISESEEHKMLSSFISQLSKKES